jgi:hypothetical protein
MKKSAVNRLGVGAVLATLVLSGCAASAADVEPTTSLPPVAIGDDYLCSGQSISREAVKQRTPVSGIGEAGGIALAEAVWDDGAPLNLQPEDGWFVAMESEELVGVMRDVEVVPDPVSGGIFPDREVLVVTWLDDATNLTPGWYVSQSGPCALTIDLGDVTVPAVELEFPPDPESQELRLLVTEQSCNSGEDAEGRVEIVSIDETEERVSLILGVRPRDGTKTCPGHPATPFTVTLSQPLGDREVMDAGLVEPRPVTEVIPSPLSLLG